MNRLIFNPTVYKCIHQSRYLQIINCYHSKTGIYGYSPNVDKVSLENPIPRSSTDHNSISNLVRAYREHGHKCARIDPLKARNFTIVPELEPSQYGFSLDNPSQIIDLHSFLHRDKSTLSEVIDILNNTYCNTMSAEFMHAADALERDWFAEKFEMIQRETFSSETKKRTATLLMKSQVFENFMHTKFATVKRYSGEGAESTLAFFDELFRIAKNYNLSDIVIGMPHRGRLALMAGVLNFPPIAIFQKMKGLSELPLGAVGTGDVLLHMFTSVNLDDNLHVTLLPNPSHLEAVSPVIVGKARARLQSLKAGDYALNSDEEGSNDSVLAVQIHGDASFTGQGVIMETIAMANLPHFRIGGSIHLVVNNQVGFTTPYHRGTSSLYCSDVMKMIGAPVIHVNGDYPEDVLKAVKLAIEYRGQFHKDILVDLVCFRRWGHNEVDDPTYTNPLMYDIIHNRPSCPDLYAKQLVEEGIWNEDDIKEIKSSHLKHLNSHFQEVGSYQPQPSSLLGRWQGTSNPPNAITQWDTGVQKDLLLYIGGKSVQFPDGFNLHPNLNRVLVSERKKRLEEGTRLDWATAEILAFGSLLCQGYNVRISGQDVGRGTFSHRHSMLVDQKTDEMFVPLNQLIPGQKGFLEVANSPLSEEAVLGFEYGMSIESPNNLVIWEAQFGDFFNGAQIIFDNFISSGETKWLLQSGIVILLPHGYDGAGPEHSSCHIERFLQMCDSNEDKIDGDNVNWKVVNPTTPAQYFHLIRRQVLQNFRKPLIVAAPKIILRLPAAVSTLDELSPSTFFKPVLGDIDGSKNYDKIETIIFCSGKHYYELIKEREARGLIDSVAILRLEALCPFPVGEISDELKKYKNLKNYKWSQEEHRNMGVWSFVNPRFQNLLNCKLNYVGRKELSAAAVGIGILHQKEIKEIMEKTFSQ